MSKTILTSVAVATLFGFAVSTPAMAEVIDLHADLSGQNQPVPIESEGNGEVVATYDTDTMVLSWTVTYQDMSGPLTGAHFHGPATAEENAGIVIAFDGIDESPFSGEAELVDEEAEQMLDGLFYANLHTAENPGGEIRGQLVQLDHDMMN